MATTVHRGVRQVKILTFYIFHFYRSALRTRFVVRTSLNEAKQAFAPSSYPALRFSVHENIFHRRCKKRAGKRYVALSLLAPRRSELMKYVFVTGLLVHLIVSG